ncbi:MAG: AAA family ATPase, partial [Muribaculaceae bacterium]|nr:AAA family ATPase [Muribaculaceae bacterium]
DKHFHTLPFGDGFILYFIIPRANRQQRPVYVGTDPFSGTFRRNNEGDYRCDPSAVSQMFAERDSTLGKVESRVLNNYTWDDIDMNSFRQYRTMFANLTPTHPWTGLSDLELMRKLGGYRKDRETGKEGFTMAGILMFGKEEAITDPECAPDFMVDYREIPSDTSTLRWSDRIYPDGTWEANLFQFYRLVLPKLNSFLPKPFKLSGDTRQDETSAHVALREAFINCLVHAQYGGSRRINIYKTPTGICMSNPGTLLVSKSQYYEGGKSESRNPALQKMFGLIGKSDKAGSGVDKILQGWKDYNWRRPYIEEIGKPDKVELFLPMEALIDDSVLAELKSIFGPNIDRLKINYLSILAATLEQDSVTNLSLQPLLNLHPADITKLLRQMCRESYLVAFGFGRGTSYQLNKNFVIPNSGASSDPDNGASGASSDPDNGASGASSDPDNGASGAELIMMSDFCKRWRRIDEIAHFIGRSKSHVRNRLIKKLLQQSILEMEFPDKPKHPAQRYRVITNNVL